MAETNQQMEMEVTNYFQPAAKGKGENTDFLGTVEIQIKQGEIPVMKVLADIRKFKDEKGRYSVGIFMPYQRKDGERVTKKVVSFGSDTIEEQIVQWTKQWCELNNIRFGEIKA